MRRLALFINQGELKRVERLVVDFVGGSDRYNLHIVDYLYFAKQSVTVFLSPGSKWEHKFSLPVNWDTSQSFPMLSNELNANVMLTGRGDMLL